MPTATYLKAQYTPEMLGGVITLRGQALARGVPGWEGKLYALAEHASEASVRSVPVTAIPYYAWGNRDAGPMQVWLRAGGV